jgi:hypothetical protein
MLLQRGGQTESNVVDRLREAVQRKKLAWLYLGFVSLHDSVTLHIVK